MAAQIADELYEAAFIPEKWPSVLVRIADAASSTGGALFVFADGAPARGKAVPRLQPLMKEFLADDSLRFSTAAARMSALQPASFVDVDSFLTPREIVEDPARIRLRALGFGAHACAAIALPTGEVAMYVFQRALKDGGYRPEHFAVLDGLRPDLARASLVAARLGLEQARGAVDALAMMRLPAAVLSGGKVKAANHLFERQGSIFAPTAFGGVAIAGGESDRLFQEALRATPAEPRARSLPVHGAAADSPVVVHILPLRRGAHDLFGGGDLLVVATAVSASALVPSPTILTGLFDLTQSEVRLATALAKGLSLKMAAEEAGLRFSTVRTYLNRIFRKTGTNQQSQLVALLKSAHPLQH
jgi:DNA-binding CsgD family transcriptional regulator